MTDSVIRRLIGTGLVTLIVAIVHVGTQPVGIARGQQPPPQTPPPQTQPPERLRPARGAKSPSASERGWGPASANQAGREGGRGQGRGRPAVFPAQQRQLADPAVIERGRSVYSVTCSACHGVDLRGGQLGGPNLLRSQVVLNDQHGELILPIVRGARAEKGMPPISMSDDDVTAVAEFMHSVAALSRGQGAPPESDISAPDPLVGDAAAGQSYFGAKCSSCHSATGDLQGLATRVPDPRALQNLWVSGGLGGRGRGRGAAPSGAARTTATIVTPSGESVQGDLLRLDDFLITVRAIDGSIRSFRRDGDVPKVTIRDPREAHRTLLTTYSDKDMHDVTAYLVTLK